MTLTVTVAIAIRTDELERVTPSIKHNGYRLRRCSHRDIPVPSVSVVSQRELGGEGTHVLQVCAVKLVGERDAGWVEATFDMLRFRIALTWPAGTFRAESWILGGAIAATAPTLSRAMVVIPVRNIVGNERGREVEARSVVRFRFCLAFVRVLYNQT